MLLQPQLDWEVMSSPNALPDGSASTDRPGYPIADKKHADDGQEEQPDRQRDFAPLHGREIGAVCLVLAAGAWIPFATA